MPHVPHFGSFWVLCLKNWDGSVAQARADSVMKRNTVQPFTPDRAIPVNRGFEEWQVTTKEKISKSNGLSREGNKYSLQQDELCEQ